MARPTDYNQDIADKICEIISDGSSLRSICLSDDMPNKATVFRWLNKHKEFSDQYARAREEQAESLADDIVAISDEEAVFVKHQSDDGESEIEVKFDAAMVARNRLRVEARKWVASKLKPKKYGDKIDVDANVKAAVTIVASVHDQDI